MPLKILKNYWNNKQSIASTYWQFWVFYLLVVLVSLANGQMGNDEGIWAYIVRVWLEEGMLPYQEAVDHKPAGIILLYGLSHALFGVNFWFPRLLAALSIALTGFILYRLNTSIFNQKAGIISIVLYSMPMLWGTINGPYISFSETFMVLFSSLALYHVFKANTSNHKKLVFSGIFLGIAVGFKQVAVLSLLTVIIILWMKQGFTKKYLLNTFTLITATFFTFVLLHLPLVNASNLGDYFHWVWLNPNSYSTIFWRIPKFLEAFLNSKIVIFYPILFIGWVYRKAIGINLYTRGLLIWGILTFIGVNLSGYYFGHYFTQWLPSLALLSGIIIAFGLQKMPGTYFNRTFIAITIVFAPWSVLFNNAANMAFSSKTLLNHFQDHSKVRAVADWIQANTNEDYIYYFGRRTNSILAHSNKLSVSKYFNTSFVNNKKAQKQVIKDLKAKKPTILIKDKDIEGYSLISDYVNNHYQANRKWKYWIGMKRVPR